jgi:starch synthase (maltosyl-transferring)
MTAADDRPFALALDPPQIVDAEPLQARFASWYELFPRSQTQDPNRHGTFDDVIARLPAIRAMGFDVLYFPPIHPIGAKHRKGANNSLNAKPGEPGSPYAIGSDAGGHDAIHPELGGFDAFRRLKAAAAAHGLEIALDFAIQCAPDHPWIAAHPAWFDWRPDGTIKYAENPPKKYQDIVNVDFYAPGAIPDLWLALRDIVLLWVREGIRLFRVDNPHTKPLPFWIWMIREVRAVHPDVIFLAEAFTRPKPMYRLAKAGFSQSYTYFTWRHSKAEFIDYLTELTTTAPKEFYRPHFFVTTPDINPYFLQTSGRGGFLIRAALAATLSGLWGVYSGFELCESDPLPGREEFNNSEKYQIRVRDWTAPGNIIAEITALNRIRKSQPALQSHLGIRFYDAFNDQILYFGKATHFADPTRPLDEIVLVAISLDPRNPQACEIEVPLWEWGLSDDASVEVEDLIAESRFVWSGKRQQIHLTPDRPYALWRFQPARNA